MDECKPLLHGAFSRWQEMVEEIVRFRVILNRCLQKMKNRAMAGSFEVGRCRLSLSNPS